MSRAKNYVSALDKRPTIHSPLCPSPRSSLSLCVLLPLSTASFDSFETEVTTFSSRKRPFSIYPPFPKVLSARSFRLLRFFAYPDSRLFHFLYRWIESRFDYTWLLEISIFLPFEKVLSSFRAREKVASVDRFRLPFFWKIEGEGRRKNIIANDTSCDAYDQSNGVTFPFFSFCFFSLSLFQRLIEIITSHYRFITFYRNTETLFRSGSGSPYQPERS